MYISLCAFMHPYMHPSMHPCVHASIHAFGRLRGSACLQVACQSVKGCRIGPTLLSDPRDAPGGAACCAVGRLQEREVQCSFWWQINVKWGSEGGPGSSVPPAFHKRSTGAHGAFCKDLKRSVFCQCKTVWEGCTCGERSSETTNPLYNIRKQ